MNDHISGVTERVMNAITLGDVARDSITGFEGVVVCVSECLHGCRRFTLQPKALHDGKPVEPASFDEPQLVLVFNHGMRREPDKTGGPRPEPTRR
jgi:hypothetical protein